MIKDKATSSLNEEPLIWVHILKVCSIIAGTEHEREHGAASQIALIVRKQK